MSVPDRLIVTLRGMLPVEWQMSVKAWDSLTCMHVHLHDGTKRPETV